MLVEFIKVIVAMNLWVPICPSLMSWRISFYCSKNNFFSLIIKIILTAEKLDCIHKQEEKKEERNERNKEIHKENTVEKGKEKEKKNRSICLNPVWLKQICLWAICQFIYLFKIHYWLHLFGSYSWSLHLFCISAFLTKRHFWPKSDSDLFLYI